MNLDCRQGVHPDSCMSTVATPSGFPALSQRAHLGVWNQGVRFQEGAEGTVGSLFQDSGWGTQDAVPVAEI